MKMRRVATAVALALSLSAGIARTEPLDVSKEFVLPADGARIGPITVSCPPTEVCPTDALEAVPGQPLVFGELPGARSGDYLLGTTLELGLPPISAVSDDVFGLLRAGEQSYQEWLKMSDAGPSPALEKELSSSPPEFSDLPQAYRNEVSQFAKSPTGHRCSVVNRALDRAPPPNSGDGNATIVGALDLIYRQQCFSNGEATLLAALERTVYFVNSTLGASSKIPCSGFIIRENIAITAKHCVVDIDQLHLLQTSINVGALKPEDALATITGPVPGTKIFAVSEPGRLFDYEVVGAGPTRPLVYKLVGNADGDYALIRLPSFSKTKFVSMPVALGQQLASLRIPSVTATQADVLRGDRSLQGRSAILDTMRFDVSPLCKIWKRKAGCIVHACQTEHGMSGSPILAVAGDGYQLVGIHAGSFYKEYPACGFSRGSYVPNYGVVPTLGVRTGPTPRRAGRRNYGDGRYRARARSAVSPRRSGIRTR